ncbi:MAG: ABC transporter permease subunit [Firmicutes bacterium]|nr:ABC transporter permease subunit [Bacillota bacterium]
MGSRAKHTWTLIKNEKSLYIMIIPVLLYYIIFCYIPMGGAIISFKHFSPAQGLWNSPWVGFQWFEEFFRSPYFARTFTNTLRISLATILFGFPAPILFALLINELHGTKFKRIVQTLSYMPHFVSLVVTCGMVIEFTRYNGVITQVLGIFGFPQKTMLQEPNLFMPVYVISGIWQEVGWGSIIYLSALVGIDQQLYEAARIDGAGRIRQTINITLPCLLPTIIIMLILRIGGLMNVGFEKIILLYNDAVMSKADVISSYVYRKGLLEANWSYSTAVGLFNGLINCILLISANTITRKFADTKLW